MKKHTIAIFAMTVFLACNQGTQEGKVGSSLIAQDKDTLMDVARAYFKVLPAVAENKDNAVTLSKIRLGKLLYYDTRLSKAGNVSCNSCHNLQTFGVDNQPVSTGDGGQKGNRNSPTVFNAAIHNMQFWDGRAKDVEEQAGMPILNPVEMAIPHKGFLVNRLNNVPLYRNLFKEAFPGEAQPLTYANLEKAIAAFERTLLTPSPFDQYMAGNANAINSEEKAGLRLFISVGCVTCHNGVGIGGGSLQRFGIVTDYRTLTKSKIEDKGREQVTGNKQDKDMFKVAGLRNVVYTYPYFHNGNIASLDSAIKIMGKVQLNTSLSENEVRQIIAFLNALTGDVNADAKMIPPELAKK